MLLLFTLLALLLSFAPVPRESMLSSIEPDSPWTIATHVYDGQGYSACVPKYFPFCTENNQTTAMREPVPVFLLLAAMLLHPAPWSGVILEIGLYIATALLLYHSLRARGCLYGLLAAFLWLISLPVLAEVGSGSGQVGAASWLTSACSHWERPAPPTAWPTGA